jgi:tetratricopeptide (TPR) repeat protein
MRSLRKLKAQGSKENEMKKFMTQLTSSGRYCLLAVSLLCAATGLSSSKKPETRLLDMTPTYSLAEQLLNDGKIDDGIAMLEQIAEANPADWEALNLIGTIETARGKLDEAESTLMRALDVDPTRPQVFSNLGVVELKRRNWDKALTYFFTAEKLDPTFVPALYNIGTLLQGNENFTQADQYYTRVIEQDPTHLMAHYKRAAARIGMKKYDAAVSDYKAVLRMDPALTSARADLGFTYFSMAKYVDAELQFKQVLSESPEFARGWYGLGISQREMEHYSDAVISFKKAVALEGSADNYHVDLALALLAVGQVDEAAGHMEKAILLGPKNGRTIYMAAVFYDDAQRPLKAIPLYEQSIALSYQVQKSKLYLAENYIKSGDPQPAKSVLKELISETPSGSEIHDAAVQYLQKI